MAASMSAAWKFNPEASPMRHTILVPEETRTRAATYLMAIFFSSDKSRASTPHGSFLNMRPAVTSSQLITPPCHRTHPSGGKGAVAVGAGLQIKSANQVLPLATPQLHSAP